jgi:hypothetical protein
VRISSGFYEQNSAVFANCVYFCADFCTQPACTQSSMGGRQFSTASFRALALGNFHGHSDLYRDSVIFTETRKYSRRSATLTKLQLSSQRFSHIIGHSAIFTENQQDLRRFQDSVIFTEIQRFSKIRPPAKIFCNSYGYSKILLKTQDLHGGFRNIHLRRKWSLHLIKDLCDPKSNFCRLGNIFTDADDLTINILEI